MGPREQNRLLATERDDAMPSGHHHQLHLLLPGLPTELATLVAEHGAAVALQRRWRWYRRYGHARRVVLWPSVRLHLSALGAWRPLSAYAVVRRACP